MLLPDTKLRFQPGGHRNNKSREAFHDFALWHTLAEAYSQMRVEDLLLRST